jgi:hypothetical protein
MVIVSDIVLRHRYGRLNVTQRPTGKAFKGMQGFASYGDSKDGPRKCLEIHQHLGLTVI